MLLINGYFYVEYYGFILVILIPGILCEFVAITYKCLVKLRNGVNDALSPINVQLERRADTIPNLVETVKGYSKHEKKYI